MNSKYALVLAVVLGVVAAFAVQQHIARIEEDQRKANEPVPVVFAKEDILGGTQVREESREFDAGRFFLADRALGGRRLSWRHPEAGTVEVFLRSEEGGTRGVWSERKGKAWVPEGGECPGRDLEGVGRPEGWKRLFCIDASDRRMLCYAVDGSAEGAVSEFARRLASSGWERRAGPAGSLAFVRGGSRCLVSAEADSGGSQVTVLQEER